jgi:NMD protein affecting ribosome stability and mRNA decay
MKMSAKFCPRCGTTKAPFFKGLCKKCFFEKNSLFDLPQIIDLEKCKACGRIRVSGKLLPQENTVLEKIIAKKTRLFDLQKPEFSFRFFPGLESVRVKVKVQGMIDSTAIEQEKETMIKFNSTKCDSCMKSVSNYHEAIIQLRFEKKDLGEKLLGKLDKALAEFSEKDPLATIIRIQRIGKGFDVLIGSNKSAVKTARQIAKAHNAKLLVSFKQIKGGIKEKPKKRFTYCIRI